MSIFNFSLFIDKSQRLLKIKTAGFALIEALISIGLIGTLSITFGIWYMNILNNYQVSTMRLKAINLATSLLEHVRAYNVLPEFIDSSPYIIHWKVDRNNNLGQFATVSLHIEWPEKGNIKNLEITTGALL